MSLVSVCGLTFAYDGSYDNIFEDASFQFDTDWKLGFIARNGRGKTTLLNLLMGKYEYRGSISASVRFDYFPFEVQNADRMAGEIIREIVPEHEPWMLERELTLLEADTAILERPFLTLSNGERTKLLLAALFLRENHFLLIDEPTNHLDMHARELVGRYLDAKSGFLLVSHDRAFLDRCVDHVLTIGKSGGIEVQRGNFTTWRENAELRERGERAENEKLKKDIARLGEAARRTAGWSDKIERSKIGGHVADRGFVGHQAAKMMKRSKAVQRRREEAVEEKSKLLRDVENAESLAISPLAHHAPRLVEAENLSLRYGGRAVFEQLSFTVRTGERVALLGSNGCGKSSVLKLLLGHDIPCGGNLHKASGLVISYVSQDTSFLQGNLRDYARDTDIDESLFKSILRKLDFSRVQFEKDMRDFSGGQKKKVLIARSLCERAHLYVWDEPLNFIDVLSRMQIEELILTYKPTMLFVEHDRAFVDAVATHVVEM